MLLKQSTARNLMVFMTDSSDHLTGKNYLTLTITASKDGSSFASISPTVTERYDGWYRLALTTSHTDTLGDLAIHITGTGADATDISMQVVAQIPGEVLTANVTQINGSATNANNAVLKLKSLDIRSDDVSVSALEIRGATGGVGISGGKAVNVLGGNAGSTGASGGDGIYAAGGAGVTTRGWGLNLDSPQTGQGGLRVAGNYTDAAALFQGDSYTDGMRVTGGYGWSGGINANISGSIGSLGTQAKDDVNAAVDSALNTAIPVSPTSGSINDKLLNGVSIASVRPKKNTGLDNFMFPMFDSTTKNPKTGLTVTSERAIDGNPFASCSNSASELSNGVYRVSLSASDLNGNKVMLRFSAPGADDQLVEIITQD